MKHYIGITLLIVITIICFLTFVPVLQFGNHLNPFRENLINNKTLLKNTTKYIINDRIGNKTFEILMWTKYYEKSWADSQMSLDNCKFSNCIINENHDSFNQSDAIVFHLSDVDPNNMPHYKLGHQKWVLFNFEVTTRIAYMKSNFLQIMDRYDWAMNYRMDSDIYTPYGYIYECLNNNWKLNYNLENKTKDICWFVSNCYAFSEREKYVEKLKQYIDVDIYGDCGQPCSRDNQLQCMEIMQKNYKFYLSFENSMCTDYVTEKLFYYSEYDIIPVVLGSADYKRLMPHNSYIDVFDFSSPQHLSSYLKEVGSDRNKYNSYFEWKKDFCIKKNSGYFSCELCEKLNKEYVKSTETINRNLIEWWFNPDNCTRISQFFDL